MTDPRLIPLAGSHNIRDLGGWPVPGGETAFRRALRADSLHRLDARGIGALQALGLAMVVDLRRQDELDHAPNPFADGLAGVTYAHVSLLEELDPTAFPAVEGQEPLLHLYLLALEQRGPAFVEIMRLIAGTDGAVLFHCAAGKDRTGMVAALLLLLAGAERETVVADYAATAPRLATLLPALREDAAARGEDLDEVSPYLGAEAGTMHAFLDHLDARHGGAEDYLRRHGLSEAELDALRRRLAPERETA